MASQIAAAPGLTDEQRRIVEWGDGPLVVIADAATIAPARPDLRCWCDDAALCPERLHTGAVKE